MRVPFYAPYPTPHLHAPIFQTEPLVPFADEMGELGATNIRVVGSMTLLNAWEPWDGKLILGELLEQDDIRWVSINTRDMNQGISESLERKREIGREAIKIPVRERET